MGAQPAWNRVNPTLVPSTTSLESAARNMAEFASSLSLARHGAPRLWFVPNTRNPRSSPKSQPLLRYSENAILVYPSDQCREDANAKGNYLVEAGRLDLPPKCGSRTCRRQTWHSNSVLCDAVAIESERWSASDHALGCGRGRICRKRYGRPTALSAGATGDL
jgi:hypothetical protein